MIADQDALEQQVKTFSDSDDETLDYTGTLRAPPVATLAHAHPLPTRSTDDDPISHFSSDGENAHISLMQRGFALTHGLAEQKQEVSWQALVAFQPELCSFHCSGRRWRKLVSSHFVWLAARRICLHI
eukprot:3205787-Amphidinium_carterae.3